MKTHYDNAVYTKKLAPLSKIHSYTQPYYHIFPPSFIRWHAHCTDILSRPFFDISLYVVHSIPLDFLFNFTPPPFPIIYLSLFIYLYPHFSVTPCPFSSVSALTKNKQIFLIHSIRKFRMEHLQSHIWLPASSYMMKYNCAFPHILGSPSSYRTLQLLHSQFPYIWGKFVFYQCFSSFCCHQRFFISWPPPPPLTSSFP